MPTQESERWIKDGAAVKEGLEAEGYTVDLQYAQDDIPKQIEQIDAMITKGAKVLIIAAKDGTALTDQLQQAADAGIKVIAYDRLINGSENVDYYTTFDNYGVGVLQANSLLAGLGVTDIDGKAIDGVTGPFNIELFAGSLDDNNTHFFFNGAMDTLQPFIDSGVLVVKSGQTDLETVATQDWKLENAQARMENLHHGELLRRQQGRRRAFALRRPVAWNHLRADRRFLHGGTGLPDHHRPGRRARLGQGHQRW